MGFRRDFETAAEVGIAASALSGRRRAKQEAKAAADLRAVQSIRGRLDAIGAEVAEVVRGIAELDAEIAEEAAKPENVEFRARVDAAVAAGSPPPGWYPCPWGQGERIWNGLQWTSAVRPVEAPPKGRRRR